MNYYDDPMTERAVYAFMQRLARGGYIVDQPCSWRSRRKRNIVTLANVNGRMARYKVRKNKAGAECIRYLG